MKKCFWKPLALVHKLEHSLTATTFYKKKLIPVSFRSIQVSFQFIPVHSVSLRSIPVSFWFIPVHSVVIVVHSGPFRCHSGSFRSIPPHSGSFRSISVFSNARREIPTKLSVPPLYSPFWTHCMQYLQGSKKRDGGNNRNLKGESAKETVAAEMRSG